MLCCLQFRLPQEESTCLDKFLSSRCVYHCMVMCVIVMMIMYDSICFDKKSCVCLCIYACLDYADVTYDSISLSNPCQCICLCMCAWLYALDCAATAFYPTMYTSTHAHTYTSPHCKALGTPGVRHCQQIHVHE
jgi:hypothetical protein